MNKQSQPSKQSETINGATSDDTNVGSQMYEFCRDLFPICRSLTGDGVRQTLQVLKQHLPELNICSVPSGTECFDWTVPPEWNIRDAYILDPDGIKIVDFKQSNLHVVGYSTPVDQFVELEELESHLYSLPDQPTAIPYITSYYKERWGFCLSHEQRQSLKPGRYRVVIDSVLAEGELNYGELVLPGETDEEIFLSTYICHPSLANNELSGPAVATFLAKWLTDLPNRQHTYRIVFIPETIGSIVYLSQHLEELKKNVVAGFVLSCVGDDRNYSYLASRFGNTLADDVANHVLKHLHPEYKSYSFLDRGSDERQYCSPGVDLPMCSIMRTKYGCYPEYHTSLDNLDLISPAGLQGAYEVYQKCFECLEHNETLKISVCCEPQLGKRGLYPTTSSVDTKSIVADMMNLLAYCDGTMTLLEVSEVIQVKMWDMLPIVERMKEEGLLIPVQQALKVESQASSHKQTVVPPRHLTRTTQPARRS